MAFGIPVSSMKIGIDARLYTQTGVGRYLKNLLTVLQRLDKVNDYIVYLRRQEFDIFEIINPQWRKKLLDVQWHSVAEQFAVPFTLLSDKLDVVHFPYFNVPILYPGKFLLTIHDLIVDHFDTGRASTLPAPFYKLKRFGYMVGTHIGAKRADFITVISETTRKEVLDHYNVSQEKLFVTYDALDIHFQETVKYKKPQRLIDGTYILYVGNAYPHKNLERLLEGFSISQKGKSVHLVLAGDDEYFYPRLRRVAKELAIEKQVIFFGNADDKELHSLYSFCSIVVFPSLMEGFGLPNLEALYCGKLPVVSDIPVFREIWGDTLPMFNPYDVRDISQKMSTNLALSTSMYQKNVAKAKQRIHKFNWEKTARETLALYERIFAQSR